ncbi:MAG: GNAT family N-acetyltransferase [Ferruginibacter sp.]
MDTESQKNIEWKCFAFEELSGKQLYEVLALRNEVFVVEQNCPYQDADEKDFEALHLCGMNENELVAYARILPPGTSYQETSIGRVVTKKDHRRNGLGIRLMQEALVLCRKKFANAPIKISAQVYLLDFYTNLGFIPMGEQYLEDNIPHMAMIFGK